MWFDGNVRPSHSMGYAVSSAASRPALAQPPRCAKPSGSTRLHDRLANRTHAAVFCMVEPLVYRMGLMIGDTITELRYCGTVSTLPHCAVCRPDGERSPAACLPCSTSKADDARSLPAGWRFNAPAPGLAKCDGRHAWLNDLADIAPAGGLARTPSRLR